MKNFYVHKNSGAGTTLLFSEGKLLQIPAFAITKNSLEEIINLNVFEEYYKIPVLEIGKKITLKKDMKGLDYDILEEYGGKEVTLNFFDERGGKINFDEKRNLIIASVILVIGIGGAYFQFGSLTLSGMSLATVVGIVLNLILPKKAQSEIEHEAKA